MSDSSWTNFKQMTLILPAYNEARSISNTVQEAVDYFEQRRLSYEVIVSADGNDGTREIVSEISLANPRVYAIGSPERGGKGKGIRNAVARAQGRWIGFADADNKTPITELDKILPHLERGIEVVIGSRGDRRSVIERSQPLYRRLGAKGFCLFMHMVTGLYEISDTQCGFKFFQGGIARDLFSRQQIDGYMVDVEILYLAKAAGYRIQQVPIRWRDDGDSRLDLLRDNAHNLKDILSLRLRRYPLLRAVPQEQTSQR